MNVFKIKENYSDYCFIIAISSLILFLSGIGFKQLWKTDETRVAGISASMSRSNEYLMPKLNGEPFLEYPPLYYWTTASFYKLFGKNLFTSRLASALSAIGTVLLVFLLSKEMKFTPFYCFMSGVIIATCGQFWSVANRCVVDMMLCFFVVGAMFCFYKVHWSVSSEKRTGNNLLWGLLFTCCIGFGILTKSLMGLAIPSSAIFFWLISENICTKKSFYKSWIVFTFCSIISLIPALIWLVQIYFIYGLQYVKTAAFVNTFGRFTGTYSQHANPVWYYLAKVPEQFLPWTIILVPMILLMTIFKKKLALNTDIRFLLCWIIFPFILLAMSEGKRPIYLLPLYPAFAILLSFLIWKSTTEVPSLTKYRWEKILMYISCVLLLSFTIMGLMIGILYNEKYTYKSFFKYYQESCNKTRPLYLYSDTESMRGAVNYYLNRDVTLITSMDKLNELMKTEKICVFIPYFDGLEMYGQVKRFKVKGDVWCIVCN